MKIKIRDIYNFIGVFLLCALYFFETPISLLGTQLLIVLQIGITLCFATMCGIAINCIYLFFKLKAWKYYKPKLVDLSLIKEVCGYSLPLVPNQISGWILSASDRTIIAKFLSVAENGVYSVANKFSNLVGTFYGFFNLAWVETVSVHYNDSDRDEFIGDMMETVSNLFVSICVGIIAIMPFVFPVMVNQQYGNAYYQIPILLIAVIFQILVGLYSAIYIALKKSSTIARTTIAGAIINVLVNLALIRFIGLYAASISTLVSYASTALYRRIDIRKYIKIKVNSLLIYHREFPYILVRNFLCVGIPYFCIGNLIREKRCSEKWNRKILQVLIVVFTITSLAERFVLVSAGLNATRDHYLSTTFLAICLFVYTLKSNWHNKGLAVIGRKCSTWLYIIHPIFITAFSVATGKLGIKSIYRCVAPIVTYCATLTFLIVMCRLKSLLVKNNQRK